MLLQDMTLLNMKNFIFVKKYFINTYLRIISETHSVIIYTLFFRDTFFPRKKVEDADDDDAALPVLGYFYKRQQQLFSRELKVAGLSFKHVHPLWSGACIQMYASYTNKAETAMCNVAFFASRREPL